MSREIWNGHIRGDLSLRITGTVRVVIGMPIVRDWQDLPIERIVAAHSAVQSVELALLPTLGFPDANVALPRPVENVR